MIVHTLCCRRRLPPWRLCSTRTNGRCTRRNIWTWAVARPCRIPSRIPLVSLGLCHRGGWPQSSGWYRAPNVRSRYNTHQSINIIYTNSHNRKPYSAREWSSYFGVKSKFLMTPLSLCNDTFINPWTQDSALGGLAKSNVTLYCRPIREYQYDFIIVNRTAYNR